MLWPCDQLDLLDHTSKMSTEILNNLYQLTTSSLKRLKTQIDDILRSRVDQANESFIDHIENFCDDDTLLDIVSAECEAIFNKKISNSSKVTTSWLLTIP